MQTYATSNLATENAKRQCASAVRHLSPFHTESHSGSYGTHFSVTASANFECISGSTDFGYLSPADQLKQDLARVGVAKFTAPDYKPGLIKHIVLFRYAPTVTPQQKLEVVQRFLSLQRRCKRNGKPYLVSIQTGSQNSGEGVDQMMEQAFIVTFRSEGDRNYYVGSPR